jgi:nitroreductase
MGYLGMDGGNPSPRERRRCIRCMHCVSTCPKQAIHFTGTPEGGDYLPVPEGELERLVLSRRSVRKFREEPPKREDLQWALDCAEYAPSGKNAHEHHWTIVYGRPQTIALTEAVLDVCRKTGNAPELPKLFEKGTDLICCGAPCMIVGWSPDDALNPVLDPAVALTTVELLLVSRGYGTCWGGYLRQVSDEDAALRAMLGVPEGSRVRCALMVGYPAEHYPNIPYRPDAQIHWIDEISG